MSSHSQRDQYWLEPSFWVPIIGERSTRLAEGLKEGTRLSDWLLERSPEDFLRESANDPELPLLAMGCVNLLAFVFCRAVSCSPKSAPHLPILRFERLWDRLALWCEESSHIDPTPLWEFSVRMQQLAVEQRGDLGKFNVPFPPLPLHKHGPGIDEYNKALTETLVADILACETRIAVLLKRIESVCRFRMLKQRTDANGNGVFVEGFLGIEINEATKSVRVGTESRTLIPREWDIFKMTFDAAGEEVPLATWKKGYNGSQAAIRNRVNQLNEGPLWSLGLRVIHRKLTKIARR